MTHVHAGRLRCLTLYAGAGGADLGLLAAGVEHVACIDADADCVATLCAAGLPGVRGGIGGEYLVRRGKGGRVVEVVPAADLSPYVGVDIVWASPPCQPYSRAGMGLGANDPRDGWPHTIAAVRLVRPRWVVVENVRGAPVETWMADLVAEGYTVSAWTLDAADYGVPQNRVREFLVAGPVAVPIPQATHSLYALAEAKWRTGAYWHRHGIAPVGEPTRKEERALGKLLDPGRGLLPWRTMRDALPGLVAPVSTSQTSERIGGRVAIERLPDEPAPTVRSQEGTGLETEHVTNQLLMFVGGGTNPRFPGDTRTERDLTDWPSTAIQGPSGNAAPEVVFAVDPKHPLNDPDSPAGTIRSGGSGHTAPPVYVRAEHYAHAGDPGVRHGPPTRRASEPDRLDRPAPTVATTEEKGTRAHGNPPDFNGGPDRASDAAWLAVGRRRLTVEECATLCAFPDGYPFQGTKTSRYRQVGNCVAAPVAEVIAHAIGGAAATPPPAHTEPAAPVESPPAMTFSDFLQRLTCD